MLMLFYVQDILCKLEYSDSSLDLLPKGTDKTIAVFNITGIAAVAKEYRATEAAATTAATGQTVMPKVHLSFAVDSSGLVTLLKAEASYELPLPPAAATEETPAAGTNTTVEAETASDATAANTTDSTSTTAAAAEKEKAKAPTKRVIKKPLTILRSDTATHPPRWTSAMITAAKNRLLELQAIDENRKAKAAALNDLEAYIYKIKNRLVDEEESLKAISTSEQRQAVIDVANTAEEWLYDDGRDATVTQYQGKMKEISDLANAIFLRFSEVEKRESVIKKVTTSLTDIKNTVTEKWTTETKPQITEEEKASLLTAVQKVEAWIEEKAELQLAKSPFEAPVFLSSEVLSQLKPVMLIYDKLVKKPKPAPVVVETPKVSHQR